MLIFHAALKDGKAFIWAEKGYDQYPTVKKSRGRAPLNPPPKTHPFAASFQEISEALSFLELEEECAFKGLVWVPTRGGIVLPSQPILGECPDSKDSIGLSGCVVWAYPLTMQGLFLLLARAEGRELLAPGLLLGKEFAFLNELNRFVFSLLVHQRFLPSLRKDVLGTVARWSPIYIGQDKTRLHLLESSFPFILSAFSPSLKQRDAPSYFPRKELEAVIEKAMDALIRYSVEQVDQGETVHDQWVHQLTSPEESSELKNTEETNNLYRSIRQWRQPLENLSSSPFKFCFKIEEPEDTSSINKKIEVAQSGWKVSYLLQSYEDPSLIVSTEEVWNPKGMKRKILDRPFFNPRQFVLASLGMATGLCPPVESSLSEAIPKGFALDSNDVVGFFSDFAPRLEEAGFRILAPNWWRQNRLKLAAKGLVETPPFTPKKKSSIWDDLKADWKIHLGDIDLSLEELRELSLLKEPVIKMRGEWVLLDKDNILKAIEFLQKKPFKPKSPLDFLQMASGISDQAYGVDIEGVESTGWISEFFSSLQSNAPLEMLSSPNDFQGSLRPYQQRGYSWISFLINWGLGSCLADDMGLGKTPQTLAVVAKRWEEEEVKPSLLICPTSLTGNWSREAAKFVPQLPVYVHHGQDRKKEEDFVEHIQDAALVITSYALLHRDRELFEKVDWDGIILDEAQNIKNPGAKQSKAAFKLKGHYRLALTGTPVENNVGDLWSIMHFLNPGYLGSQDLFKKQFFKPIQIEKSRSVLDRLKQMTQPLILRRLKTDRSIITDLPDKIETKEYCQLTNEQISLYESVVQDANQRLETSVGIERKGIILATLSKLKQICNHPVNFLSDGSELKNRSSKFERLEEILEEIYAVNDRCLIFTQYAEMGHLLKVYLEENTGKEALFLHGGTPKKKRDQMVERFQQKNALVNTFILSIKAGGVGLNLTKANHVLHFDRWWNPAVENQATDRAFRIGQKKNVQVHKFICTGTIEERIDALIESKKEVAASVVGTGESWLTELSTDNLKELWKLQVPMEVS